MKNLSKKTHNFTFIVVTIFYFFESAQMSYFNVLAPYFLSHGIYLHAQISSLSAAYYYGDVVGLLPAGYLLDRFPMRKMLLWAIFGSMASAFLLFFSTDFTMQWIARFLCGLFGGTFSFIGGIRIISSLFSKRFTFYIGLFLSAGMLGGLVCQYPLLLLVNHFNTQAAMLATAAFGALVMMMNVLFLHPPVHQNETHIKTQTRNSTLTEVLLIIKNTRNWLDCIMVILLDTPVSIIGTLWGVVIAMHYYHFSDALSAWMVMLLFLGLMVGLPLSGVLSDRFHHSRWIIILGAIASSVIIFAMILLPLGSDVLIGVLFFALGLFSSCQSLGFTWLTKNMRPELIGINSSFNSMVFMSANGAIKQFTGFLLTMPSLLAGHFPAVNVLLFMLISMVCVVFYAVFRR